MRDSMFTVIAAVVIILAASGAFEVYGAAFIELLGAP